MVQLAQKFKVDDPSLQGGLPLIDEKQYKAVITKSDWIQNKKQNGHFIALTVVIADGPFADTEFVERLNVDNPNATAVKIAYKTLADISKALGFAETPDNTEQLHNKLLMIDIKNETSDPYDKVDEYGVVTTMPGSQQSVIKKFLPLPTAAAPLAQQAATAAQVVQPQPSAAPTPAPTEAAPAAVPSWATPQA